MGLNPKRLTRWASSFIVAFATVFPLAAETYYIDSKTGQDSWTGKSPDLPLSGCIQNCAGPWQSLEIVYSSAALFKPGDSILLKRGSTWNDGMTIRVSGNPAHPILMGAYGSGDAPLISPPNPIGPWTSDTSLIWRAPVLQPPKSSVWVDGIRQEMARTPNPRTLIFPTTLSAIAGTME